MNPITFELAADNIKYGVRGSDTSCPFALAISSYLESQHIHFEKVSVTFDDVVIYFKDSPKLVFHTSKEMVEVLETFDWVGREYVKPDFYTLLRRIN